jgi:hypothetical protein
MLTTLAREELRIAKLRRREFWLMGPALISLLLILIYIIKSFPGEPPDFFQSSFILSILWYCAPTPTVGASVSFTDVYSVMLLSICFSYILAFRLRRNQSKRLKRLKQEVFDEQIKRDLKRGRLNRF